MNLKKRLNKVVYTAQVVLNRPKKYLIDNRRTDWPPKKQHVRLLVGQNDFLTTCNKAALSCFLMDENDRKSIVELRKKCLEKECFPNHLYNILPGGPKKKKRS